MTTTPLPPTWITLMPEAEQIVKGKHIYKRFIDGTPLSNDVPCWMVEFALEHVAQARADLEAENKRLREALEGVLKIGRGTSGRIIIEGWQEEVIRAALKGSNHD